MFCVWVYVESLRAPVLFGFCLFWLGVVFLLFLEKCDFLAYTKKYVKKVTNNKESGSEVGTKCMSRQQEEQDNEKKSLNLIHYI